MRKTLLTLGAIALSMASINANADDKRLVDKTEYSLYSYDWQTQTYIKLDEPTLYDYNRYFYDSTGKLYVEQTSFCQYRYTYNAEGKTTQRAQWAQNGDKGFRVSSTISYEYDTNGNLTKETSVNGNYTTITAYSEYENGEYKVKQSLDEGGNVTSETHYALTFDAEKRLTEKVVMYKNAEGGYDPSEKYTYSYANGKLAKETYSSLSGEVWSEQNATEYTYDEDGDIKEKKYMAGSGDKYQERITKYTYTGMNASYTPKNVKAEPMTSNRIYVSWDAVEGASAYKVMFDNTIADAATTEFMTPTLMDGEHGITVMAVINGETRNMSDFVFATVTDPGRKPVENFQVVKAVKQANDWGYIDYFLDFTWDKPETSSTINSYKIYIDNGTNGENPTWLPNQQVTDPEQTSFHAQFGQNVFQVPGGEEVNWGYLDEGYECKIWITAIYATGESDKSNIVTMNVYTTDVKSIEADENAPIEIFSTTGIKMGSDINALPSNAIYIVKQGKSVKKIAK